MMTPTATTEEKTVLVLSRKRNQQIIIQGPVIVTILDVKGSVVKLGFESQDPETSKIFRGEIALQAMGTVEATKFEFKSDGSISVARAKQTTEPTEANAVNGSANQ